MNDHLHQLFDRLRQHEFATRRGPEITEAAGRQTGFAGLHINADGSVLVLWHQRSMMFSSLDELDQWSRHES